MGWRTGWRRHGGGRPAGALRVVARRVVLGIRRAGVGRVAVVGAVLCLAGAGSGTPSASAVGPWSSYGFDADARSVGGATSTGDAPALAPGTTYRSSLPVDGRLYYRLDLDASSNVYVSVTAVPGSGTTVSATDGIKVSVQDANSHSCSIKTASVGTDRRPHPLTAVGARDISRPASIRCRDAGAYYVLVERVHRAGSSSDDWGLELATVSEPGLKEAGATSAPEVWNSASPAPVTGEAVSRAGGSGFAGAPSVGQGVWHDGIVPGQTLFYAVPVDWGRQLYATAELGSSDEGDGLVSRALVLSLYNPARGLVDDVGTVYDGSQRAATLKPLPPVAYANRYDVSDRVSGMRFAGSYYLVVHLSEQVADRFGKGPFDLTLRIRVTGTAAAGPEYAGESEPPGVFEAEAAQGRETAAEGSSGTVTGDDTAMRLLAAGGIGTGTALLMGLGVWMVVGRRRSGGAGADW
ncbi:hypothetical protein [Streptomyces cellulosae]|uniref:Aromatic ring-opening dioxygenase LigA n=1 Tax=Streptomyces cellulosae TaxID=1968 RepID=A0ABW7Y448_STRCE